MGCEDIEFRFLWNVENTGTTKREQLVPGGTRKTRSRTITVTPKFKSIAVLPAGVWRRSENWLGLRASVPLGRTGRNVAYHLKLGLLCNFFFSLGGFRASSF
jgi:hypothetical protein